MSSVYGGSVLIWVCNTATGTWNQSFNVSTMDYLIILAKILLQAFRSSTCQETSYPTQHDNDPKHSLKIMRKWLLYLTPESLNYPQQSPSINPIGHLYHTSRKKYIRELYMKKKEAIMEKWLKISHDTTENLVEYICRRLKKMLQCK